MYNPQYQSHDLYVRDFREQITPTPTQRTTLIVAGCYIIAIAILWCVCDVWGNERELTRLLRTGMSHSSTG